MILVRERKAEKGKKKCLLEIIRSKKVVAVIHVREKKKMKGRKKRKKGKKMGRREKESDRVVRISNSTSVFTALPFKRFS